MKPILFTSYSAISILFCFISIACLSQTNITRIYTDHNGFFTSSTGNIQNADVSTHHLLAFQTGSTIWSTGVNNAILTSNSVTFTPLQFESMPASVYGNNPGAVIGIGRRYGGFSTTPVANGCYPAVAPPFGNNISAYLTDGINGLDLSTAIFNIGGNIVYTVNQIDNFSIGDGIPDIIITQTGDINNAIWDRFRFRDASNNIVGNEIQVDFSTVGVVARPYWKFYSINTLSCGASSASTRDLRLLAFDFADLGINASNYMNVATFEHQMSPNSDVAFIAYNTLSVDILPITLLYFDAELYNRQVILKWETVSEQNNDYFTVERSSDGQIWEHVLTREGAGNSTTSLQYEDVDNYPLQGTSYYRLKQTDFDGKQTHSHVVVVNLKEKGLEIYPNPAETILSVKGEGASGMKIINLLGQDVTEQISFVNKSKNFVLADIQSLEKGYYFIQCNDEVYPIVVK